MYTIERRGVFGNGKKNEMARRIRRKRKKKIKLYKCSNESDHRTLHRRGFGFLVRANKC